MLEIGSTGGEPAIVMFLKSLRHDQTSKARAGGRREFEFPATLISADTKVGGDLTGVGEVHIDGEIGGDVRGRRVSVGVEGTVRGDIFTESADIAGTVFGRIEAVSVTVASSAKIVGSITHKEIEIEKGAKVKNRRPWRPQSYFDQNRKW